MFAKHKLSKQPILSLAAISLSWRECNSMLMRTLLAFQESSSPTQTRELLNSLKQDELIDIFVDAADGVVTRDIATIYLKASNWNIEQAFSCLVEEDKTTPVQEDSQEVETGSSSR